MSRKKKKSNNDLIDSVVNEEIENSLVDDKPSNEENIKEIVEQKTEESVIEVPKVVEEEKEEEKEENISDNSSEKEENTVVPEVIEPKKEEENKKKKPNKWIIIGLSVLIFVMMMITAMMGGETYQEGSLTYNEFQAEVKAGNIESVIEDGLSPLITVVYKEGVCQEEYDEETGELKELNIVENKRIETVINPSDDDFYKNLAIADVKIMVKDTTGTTIMVALLGYLPTFLMMGLLIWYMMSTLKG